MHKVAFVAADAEIGHSDNDITGDEGVGADAEAGGGSLALLAGGDQGLQPEGLMDDGVEDWERVTHVEGGGVDQWGYFCTEAGERL